MKRGIVLGVLLMMALHSGRRWWERFSAPYGSGPMEMRGRRYW